MSDFSSRVRELVEEQGAVLTDRELARVVERYPNCRGKEEWDVRAYAGHHEGTREYRVVRGDRVEDVYASPVRVSAVAVGVALNTLEVRGLATG